MSHGALRVYLGAAPGVGKTYRMLEEGHRRQDRGTDVVVGFVETHGRPYTAAMLDDLEVMPRTEIVYRGSTFTEMDVDAILAPAARRRARRRDGAHERARLPQRQTVAGHPGAPRRRDDRHHHGQRAAPGIDQRRRPADHRRGAARNRAGRDRAPGRADRARRHGPRGAAAANGARQHLQAGEGRRRARQLLPRRQPDCAAGAGAAVARRQGRRSARPISRRASHLRDLGDPGTRRRRADRWPGRRHADPSRRPDRRPDQGR